MHYINTFQTTEPQRGIGLMPKRGCDVTTCEVAKFYRMNNNGLCQVISMTVPRKSDLFQEDLYPDTLAEDAAISAEEWIDGKDADPITFSLKVSNIWAIPARCLLSVRWEYSALSRTWCRLGRSASLSTGAKAYRTLDLNPHAFSRGLSTLGNAARSR